MMLLNKPFVFARHAQSTLNADSIIAGFTDSPLSEKGIQQAQQAAAILNDIEWSAVVTSTLQRTQQTAQYAVPQHAIVAYEQLKERNWGDLEGTPMDQPLVYEETPANGESWQTFENRVIGALNDILSSYSRPLIIAHSGVYRVLNKVINGTPDCPRIANVTPISFIPNEDQTGWTITPFEGNLL